MLLTEALELLEKNGYEVSDNAVRKWCKLYGIPVKAKELKEFVNKFNV